MGYTSQLSTAVWVGNSNNREINSSRAYGGTTSALVWRDYMNRLILQGVLTVPSNQAPAQQVPTEVTPPVDQTSSPDQTSTGGQGQTSTDQTPAGNGGQTSTDQNPTGNTGQGEAQPPDTSTDQNNGNNVEVLPMPK
jgi:penicillin-binding protein 1A